MHLRKRGGRLRGLVVARALSAVEDNIVLLFFMPSQVGAEVAEAEAEGGK